MKKNAGQIILEREKTRAECKREREERESIRGSVISERMGEKFFYFLFFEMRGWEMRVARRDLKVRCVRVRSNNAVAMEYSGGSLTSGDVVGEPLILLRVVQRGGVLRDVVGFALLGLDMT